MLRRLVVAVFGCTLALVASAAELETAGSISNLYWAPDRIDNTAGHTMTGSELFWQVEGSVSQDFSDGLRFKGGVEQDPILKRRLFAELGFDVNNLTIHFTPFVGLINTAQKWFNPGLEASVRYVFPGVGFVEGGFSTSFAPLSKVGDYYISSEFASVGISVENGIITFSVDDRSSIVRSTSLLDVQDYQTRYLLDTEIFYKNFPVRTNLILGYQLMGRAYIASSPHDTPLHSALGGLRLTMLVGPDFSVYSEGIASLVNLGLGDTLLKVPDSSLLFELKTGLKFHL